MVKRSFELKKYGSNIKLTIIGHENVGRPDWRQVIMMTADELDDMRRLIMHSYDNCAAKCHEVKTSGDTNIISHDMKRLSVRQDDFTRTVDQLVQKVNAVDFQWSNYSKINNDRLLALEDDTRLQNVESEVSNALAGYHTLAKCIDDLKVDIEHWKTDVAIMKFAFTTHMGVSHAQDKSDADKQP